MPGSEILTDLWPKFPFRAGQSPSENYLEFCSENYLFGQNSTTGMQKRLFLAVSLPEDIKKRLFRFVEKEYARLPIRRVRRENLHLTINFLGYVPDEDIPDICEVFQDIAGSIDSFEIEFEKTEIGPNKENPKMIWAAGKTCQKLAELKFRLDKALRIRGREREEFRPHITLGRIKRSEWKKVSPSDMERKFFFSIPVNSVELFESKFEKGKRVYYVLDSFSLK